MDLAIEPDWGAVDDLSTGGIRPSLLLQVRVIVSVILFMFRLYDLVRVAWKAKAFGD
jgi:hypothetical protein